MPAGASDAPMKARGIPVVRPAISRQSSRTFANPRRGRLVRRGYAAALRSPTHRASSGSTAPVLMVPALRDSYAAT